jgi:hypothetical protein
LIIQQPHYVYPATIKDLWNHNHKSWNQNLINSLFPPNMASQILQTPIIDAIGQDSLVWKLTPAGTFSTKSAYKHCFSRLQLPQNQQPRVVPQQVISLLNQVWSEKGMIPRVQTFAWRLLRRALATGKRAGRFSTHIDSNCSRCGQEEDEMHLFFLCPFAKAAWYSSPWFIKTELLFNDHQLLPDMIHFLLSSNHPCISLKTLCTFLWCLWKSRSDFLFNKIKGHPKRIFFVVSALLQDNSLYTQQLCSQMPTEQAQEHHQQRPQHPPTLNSNLEAGNVLLCDAAWKVQQGGDPYPAGLGVIIHLPDNSHCRKIHIAAMSPPVSSPLQAETSALLLATKLADIFRIHDPAFYTDNSVLASAAKASNILSAPGHWSNRPLLADIQAAPSFNSCRVYHINRANNTMAHHQAKLAVKIQNRSLLFRCLGLQSSQGNQCPVKDTLHVSSVLPFTLLSVKCS